MQNNTILSCDWGSSNFRLRVINTGSYNVSGELKTGDGISSMDTGATDREKRLLIYLQSQIDSLKKTCTIENETPVLISGMASSSKGIRELPYASIPFKLLPESLITEEIAPSDFCSHPVILISGVCSKHDVMRGEETQLLGLKKQIESLADEEFVYIFPGTHSKHIFVSGNMISDFKTYMTGDLFNILTTHSILKDAVKVPASAENLSTEMSDAFTKGVRASANDGLLSTLFTARTNILFNYLPPELNYYYLSGLMIGAELRNTNFANRKLIVSAGSQLSVLYQLAIQSCGLSKNSLFISPGTADLSAAAGQIEVYNQYKKSAHE